MWIKKVEAAERGRGQGLVGLVGEWMPESDCVLTTHICGCY